MNNWPIIQAMLSIWVPLILMLLYYHLPLDIFLTKSFIKVAIYGFFYGHLAEYIYHRWLLHGHKFPRLSKHHLKHHKVFANNLRSKNPKDWQHITTSWYVFPVLFFVHFCILGIFLSPNHMAAFLCGDVVYFCFFYELFHWFFHHPVEWLDYYLGLIPILGWLWQHAMKIHGLHHEWVDRNFNFGEPHLGDRICGTYNPRPPTQQLKILETKT